MTLFERRRASANEQPQGDAELVGIADRRHLIVVNSAVVKRLPGVSIIPLNGNRAFLALEPGQGIADLELIVRDRLEDATVGGSERQALEMLRTRLLKWRRDRTLRMHSRAIVVVERVAPTRRGGRVASKNS